MNETHLTNEQLIDYAHGELAPHEDAAVHAHITACSTCARAHEAEVQLGELLRAQAQAEELELPPGLVTSIYANAAAAGSAQPSWWERIASMLRPAILVPALAALLVISYVGFTGLHVRTAQAATIDPSYYLENHAALAATMPLEDGTSVLPVSFTSDGSAPDESGAP